MNKTDEFGGGDSSTTVGANVVLSGTLKDSNDIVVHGKVEGEVISEKSVFIGDSANVKGPITAQSITISGRVKGAVTAHEKLELTPTAKVFGSIATKDLVIQSGAIFVGKSEMTNLGEDAQEVKSSSKKDSEPEDSKPVKEKNEPDYEVEA